MLGVYGFLIAGLAAALATRPIPGTLPRQPLPVLDTRLLIALCAALVGSTGWHERLIAAAADGQQPLPAWLASLPVVPVVDVGAHGRASAGVSSLAEIASIVEAGLLAVLAAACAGKRLSRLGWAAGAVAGAAMATIALHAHGTLSADVYAYVADGVLGASSYRPEPGVLHGMLAPVAMLWGDPPPPCAYGPAWLLPATMLVHGVRDLGDAVLRFRLFGAACVVAIAVSLLRLRAPLAVIATFALNPAIWLLYVADAHNDAWPVALVIAARAASKRAPFAALLSGAAGAAKLPFVALGSLCGAGTSARSRLVIGAGGAAVALAASALVGRDAYFEAIVRVARLYATPEGGGQHALQIAALLGACTALAVALGPSRTAWPAAFSFLGIGFAPFPWYALWGLPYALLTDRADAFLCLLPLVTFVTATSYVATPLWPPLIVVVFVAAGTYAYRNVRAYRLRIARP